MSVLATQVLGINDFAHGLILQFAFEPGNDVQVSEGACFDPVIFQMFDLTEQFFEFGFDVPSGNLEAFSQKLKHFFFHHRQVFHFRHKPVNRFGQRFHEFIIPQFIMCEQMHEACITLQIVAQIHVVIDDQLQVIDGCIVITTAEIQGGNFVVEYQYPVMIDICRIFCQFVGDFRNQEPDLL